MEQRLIGTGRIEFEIPKVTKKHEIQTWKKTAMVFTNDDLSDYYSWWLNKRFDLKFIKVLRGSHISFINERVAEEKFKQAREVFNNKKVTFQYNPLNIRSNGLHWWLKVESQNFEDIRKSIGLDPIPYYNFHLTIGMVNEYNKPHSDYILNICRNFHL